MTNDNQDVFSGMSFSQEFVGSENGPEKLSILLVDDNPGKLLSHEAVLSELGENLVTASSGTEALQKLLRQDFAVVLLDVNMPGMDGFETAELIRQRPRFEQTPIIFVTAYNTTEIDRLRGYKLGAVDYLYLPIVPEVLKAKVRAFVGMVRQNLIIRRQAECLAFHNQEQARQLKVIQDLNRNLLETNKELQSFSYTISHDLRAPLRALKGFSAHLLESCAPSLDETARDCAERIYRAAICLDNLTHDLLKYSHIARQDISLVPVQIRHLIDDFIALDERVRSTAAEIIVAEPLHEVLAQPSLLMHCLANLVGNAIKFVAPGVKPRVRLGAALAGDKVRITVTDNGIGIHPSHHARIFGLFERVGDVHRHDGTGIGLAIVARAVERMNGSCGVESAPGEGSCFWIELAAARPSQNAPESQRTNGKLAVGDMR
jgi:two-component system, sensor histidine kinase and response regulator